MQSWQSTVIAGALGALCGASGACLTTVSTTCCDMAGAVQNRSCGLANHDCGDLIRQNANTFKAENSLVGKSEITVLGTSLSCTYVARGCQLIGCSEADQETTFVCTSSVASGTACNDFNPPPQDGTPRVAPVPEFVPVSSGG